MVSYRRDTHWAYAGEYPSHEGREGRVGGKDIMFNECVNILIHS